MYVSDLQEGTFLFGLDRGIHGLPGGTGTLTAKKKIFILHIYAYRSYLNIYTYDYYNISKYIIHLVKNTTTRQSQ